MEFLFEQLANWKFYLIGAYPAGALTGLVLNIALAVLSIIIGLFFGHAYLFYRQFGYTWTV